MTTSWDEWRRDRKGKRGELPTCSNCGATSVLDPCRSCANTDQFALDAAELDLDDAIFRAERYGEQIPGSTEAVG